MLKDTKAVITALGGVQSVADLAGCKYSAAWMWTRQKTFPSNTYVVLQRALEKKGLRAPASLWGMRQ